VAVGSDGRWEAGIGDPTVIGWVTVAAYAVAALLSLRCARRAAEPLEFRFWAVLSVALVLLGINKQLDLQSLVTQVGRDLAFAQGWYENRRIVQAAFIGFLIAAGLADPGCVVPSRRRDARVRRGGNTLQLAAGADPAGGDRRERMASARHGGAWVRAAAPPTAQKLRAGRLSQSAARII
jgi:hypothetical protein